MKNSKTFIGHSGLKGFALIVTLSLMILLTVIAVGLLSLSSIALRSSSQESAANVARANARLALIIALGELQSNLGPDTRITARAESFAKDSRVAAAVSPSTPQAWWVGVSDSDRTKKLPTPTGASPVVWLVSGLSGNTPASQLGNPLDPVTIIGKGSLDLAVATGGNPIQAGRVAIRNSSNKTTGAYAYFVDDNGMKAQLVASRAAVRNDSTAGPSGGPFGGGVIPGTYSLAILDQMSGLTTQPADLLKLVSTHNLPLARLSDAVTKAKFFSFTTSSQGVLSDVKRGGLKKDLTIAFENPAVFSNVFPANDPSKYIVVDPVKRPAELASGYIHWGIFRDYYNLKKNFITGSVTPSLAPSMIQKEGMVDRTPVATDGFRMGKLGPHAMASNAPSTLPTQPYGAFDVSPTNVGNPAGYSFNPISPVLASFQETAWVSQVPAEGTSAAGLSTNVQLFSSHYNPYNVNLVLNGKSGGAGSGPRVHNYPQVLFTVSGVAAISRVRGLNDKLQTHVKGPVTLEAGRSHIMGFASDVKSGDEIDGSLYSQSVGAIVNQRVYKKYPGTSLPASGAVTLKVEFAMTRPTLMHGIDEEFGSMPNTNREVAQVFFAPFSWDSIPEFTSTIPGSRPGKIISKTVSSAEINSGNTKLTLGYRLRTTRESQADAIRPLVDANIRAVWNNPRWDSPLGLPLLAAYSSEGNGEIVGQTIPQMEIEPNDPLKRGFSYWGNSRSYSNSNDRVILFDVPRKDLVSIGQLQHANAGRFSYEPTYIVGNSYANPRIPLDSWKAAISDTYSSARGLPWAISGNFNLYDASYLVNEVMFDSYVFTTIPQVSDDFGGGDLPPSSATYAGLMAGTLQLPNPRYIPYRPPGSDFTDANLKVAGNATTGSFFHNAGHLLVDGAFNVNSTSVDAWEAFLSGTHKLPVVKVDANGAVAGFHSPTRVRFPRAASHLGDGMPTSSIDSSYWTGFRELEQSEVRSLAQEIVAQINLRGPALTLGEFINRKLDTSELAKSGPLQAALDATVNKNINATYEGKAGISRFSNIPATSTQGAGFPGQLLQGDVLQALAPCMTVRSDTFTIRGYGEARDSNNNVTARSWCEAVVQRVPDPMVPATGGGSALQELAKPTSPFGRRFGIVSFRWLHPEEV